MIKECPVLMTNDVVTVVRFEKNEVQLPSIHKNIKTVRVAHENGRYFVADDSYEEKSEITVDMNQNKNKHAKKTTIQEDVIDIDETH